MKLTLITPTFGRSTLPDLLPEVVPQLKKGDEFIIVGDGPVPLVQEIASYNLPGVVCLETPEFVGDFGATPIDFAIQHAKGDFIFFIGDDDRLMPNAFETIRKRVVLYPSLPHLFAINYCGTILSRSLRVSTVSGQQIVFPRDLSRIPKYAGSFPEDKKLESDWYFIDNVVKAWGDIIFHDEVITTMPTQNFGRRF